MDPMDRISNPSQDSPRSPSTSNKPGFKPSIDVVPASPGLQSNSTFSERPFGRSPTCSEDQQPSYEEPEKCHVLLISNLHKLLGEETVKALFSEYGKIKSIRYYYDLDNCFNGTTDISYWHIADAYAALKDIEKMEWEPGDEPLRARLLKGSPACSEDQQPSCEELEKSYNLLIPNLNRRMDEVDVDASFSKCGKIKSIRPFSRSPTCSEDQQPSYEEPEKCHALRISNLLELFDKVTVKKLFSRYGKIKSVKYYYDLRNCFNGKVDISYWHIKHAYAALKDIEKMKWASGMLPLTAWLKINDLSLDNDQL